MRLAFDLGLHVDGDPYVEQGIFTAQEGEARRSTFWSCVVVNQYVQAYFSYTLSNHVASGASAWDARSESTVRKSQSKDCHERRP